MRNLILTIFLGLLITLNFSAYSKNIDAESRFEIIDVMNKYAIGIDTKDYVLFRSIFTDDVEVSIVYTSNFGTGNTVNISNQLINDYKDKLNKMSPEIFKSKSIDYLEKLKKLS